jgi:hypothetical protein
MPTVGLRWVKSFDIPTSCSAPVLAIALRVRRHHYVKMKVNRTHSTLDGSADSSQCSTDDRYLGRRGFENGGPGCFPQITMAPCPWRAMPADLHVSAT